RTIAKSALTANDTDVDNTNAELNVTVVGNAVGGTVGIVGSNVIFTPDFNFNGEASFDYTVSDGALTDLGNVVFTITPVNDAPVAVASGVTTNENTAKRFSTSDFQFIDIENDDLASITIATLNLANGDTLRLNGTDVFENQVVTASDIPDLVYTPASNASGEARSTFEFTVNDADSGTIAATMTIDVSNGAIIDLAVPSSAFVSISPNATFAGSAGDVNGDGFDDVLVADGSQRAWIVFWNPERSGSVDLLSSDSGIVELVGSGGGTGRWVAGAGDVNNDGYDDVLIGAPFAGAGEVYLVYGGVSIPAMINLNALDGRGVTIFGADAGDEFGREVGGAGDFNGDGYADIVVGARRADGKDNLLPVAGETYVIYGAMDLPASIDTRELGNRGTIIYGAEGGTEPLFGGQSGFSVDGAGDFNGDGIGDIVIGAYNTTANGAGYIILGNIAPPQIIDLVEPGPEVITVLGSASGINGTKLGRAVGGRGDINGDGFADVLFGGPGANGVEDSRQDAGDTIVIFGSPNSPNVIDTLSLGSAGMRIIGAKAGDNSGRDVAMGGDINGDGFDDLIIGAIFADGLNDSKPAAGDVHVLFGRPEFPSRIDLAEPGASGIVIHGEVANSKLGLSLAVVGDANGDGFDDIVIGSPYESRKSYLVFGSDFSTATTHAGSASRDTLTGSTAPDVMNGAQDNDLLFGQAGTDVLIGGQGDDILTVSDLTFRRVVGGNGDDVLALDGANITLDLTTIADNRIVDIEAIDLTGSGDNSLKLDFWEVVNISSHSNTLLVRRNTGDTVDFGSGWTPTLSQTINGVTYDVFTQGTAILGIQTITQPSIVQTLLPNTANQRVPIYSTQDIQITGINFRLQLGDGTGPLVEPIFNGVDLTGSVFEAFANTASGGPVDDAEQFIQSSIVFNTKGNTVSANGLLATLLIDTTGIDSGDFDLLFSETQIGTDTAFILPGGNEQTAALGNVTLRVVPTQILDRHVFYNNSFFDGNSPTINANDDSAIATDKIALFRGETASFVNYTSYLRGINGIFVDIVGLADPVNLDASGFTFKTGNVDDVAMWEEATVSSSVVVREGAGVNGSDRIVLVFPDGSFKGTWLEVTVKADAVTGLASPDVFYFGNATGESGNSPTNTFVDGTDFARARDNQRNFLNRAPIDSELDYNRDSFVDGSDLAIARDHNTNFLTALRLLVLTAEPTPTQLPMSARPSAPMRVSVSEEFHQQSFPEPQFATSLLSTEVSRQMLLVSPVGEGSVMIIDPDGSPGNDRDSSSSREFGNEVIEALLGSDLLDEVMGLA
ncbi:MAG: FG-GAP repeat protein, partial [Rhodopirellula sp.]|nr:FG-GAP repeat protein [Rhodopirellula sp.]